MSWQFSEAQIALRDRCRELAAEFATRSAEHDRDASHPAENYAILREEGFHALNVPERWGGRGIDFLGHRFIPWRFPVSPARR